MIFERACFNRRCQAAGESVEQFITSLYTLIENCDYRDFQDQMIRDRIVVMNRYQSHSERLQMDPDLTLRKAKKLVRQREAVHEQQALLKVDPKVETLIDSLRQKPSFKSKGSRSQHGSAHTQRKPPPAQGKCSRCGRGPYS